MTPDQQAAHDRLSASLPSRTYKQPMYEMGRPAKPVLVDGVLYDSIKACCEKLGLPRKKLYELIEYGLAKVVK